MMTAKELKEWAETQWQSKGLFHTANGNVFTEEPGGIRIQAGHTFQYTSKETKRRQKGLAMYNPKLREVILAEATREMRDMEVEKPRKAWDDPSYEVKPMPHYTWPKDNAPAVEPPATPRKRVSRKQVEAAAAILAKVPQNELTAFLARFGLTLSAAVTIANASDVETMARQFLRAMQ